jgi:hypothetical protein
MMEIRGGGRPQVSFVLPSYNEEANIATALDRTLSAAKRLCSEFEIVVIDDGSTDRTADLVRNAITQHRSIKLVSHRTNRGYGEALRSGFAAAQFDFVFFTDADNQFDMNELELLLVWADKADVVAGYRKVRRDPFMRRVNAWAWNRIVRWLFYVPVRDIDCAFKLFRREALQQIDIESRGAMINTEIMVKLARSGCTIVEVGVSHFPRTSGAPQGAKVRVIARALREVKTMHPRLSKLAPCLPNLGVNGAAGERNGHASINQWTPPAVTSEDWFVPPTEARSNKTRSTKGKTSRNSGKASPRRKAVGADEKGEVAVRLHGDMTAKQGKKA